MVFTVGTSLLVQRYFANTVDGIVDAVRFVEHTVIRSLHYHAAAKNSAEVGTLDGVQNAAGIQADGSLLLPTSRIRHPYFLLIIIIENCFPVRFKRYQLMVCFVIFKELCKQLIL